MKNNKRSILSILTTGVLYSMIMLSIRLNSVNIGGAETPKAIRDGNLSMFKSIIISDTIIQGLLICLIPISLIILLPRIFRIKRLYSIISIIIVIAVLISFFSVSTLSKNKSIQSEFFESLDTKAKSFVNDLVNEKYTEACTNYVSSTYYNSFISTKLYSKAMKRLKRNYGDNIKIGDFTTTKIFDYTLVSFNVVHNSDTFVIYNVAFNKTGELTAFYLTLPQPSK